MGNICCTSEDSSLGGGRNTLENGGRGRLVPLAKIRVGHYDELFLAAADVEEQHRHRYYGRMGIYQNTVPEGGRAQQIEYKSDLRELYSDNFDRGSLAELGAGSGPDFPLGRSRTLSSNSSAFATISIALNEPIDETLLYNGSLLGSTVSTVDGSLGVERRSKFGKRLDKILLTLKGG